MFFRPIPATPILPTRIRRRMTFNPRSSARTGFSANNRPLCVGEEALVWQALFRRQRTALERHGSSALLRALNALESGLTAAPMPQIPQLDAFLSRLSGWRLVAGHACGEGEVNWNALANQQLVVSQKLRGRHELDGSVMNDWFVGAFGRLPALLVPDFAQLIQRLGQIGQALQTDPHALSQLHRIHGHLVERSLVIEVDGIGRESAPRLFGASLVSHFQSVRGFDPLDPRWQLYSWEALAARETAVDARFIVRSWKDVHADLDRWFTSWQSAQRPNHESRETAQCFG